MRLFLDANLLFSAAKTDGAIRRLLSELSRSGHECWVDPYVIGEARRNLEAKEPGAVTELDRILVRLCIAPKTPATELPTRIQLLPEKDRPVLAAAIHHRCTVLITGDRTHFGVLYGQTIGGVTIHSPRSVAEALLTGQPTEEGRP